MKYIKTYEEQIEDDLQIGDYVIICDETLFGKTYEGQKLKPTYPDLYRPKCYWLIPTDDRFEKSLLEINCPGWDISFIFLKNKDFFQEKNYIFVSSSWGWTPYKGILRCKGYEKMGYKFMGAINIPDYEFDAKKYNI